MKKITRHALIACAILLLAPLAALHAADATETTLQYRQPAVQATRPTTSAVDLLRPYQALGFVGDSITQGKYPKDLQALLATRYPGRDLWTIDFGAAGQTSTHGPQRIGYDIFGGSIRPDVVFINFGMNDVAPLGFTTSAPRIAEESKKRREQFTTNLREMIRRCGQRGAKVVVLAPTPFDDATTSLREAGTRPVAAKELERFAGISRDVAAEARAMFIDLHTPLDQYNKLKQADDPSFTIIRDRVHPDAAGNLLITSVILKALKARPQIYDITLDVTADAPVNAAGAKVSAIVRTGGGLKFSLNESAMPFPVPTPKRGLKVLESPVDYAAEWNRQRLTIRNLPAGEYALKIDDTPVGTYSAKALAAGIDLGSNTNTPQYQAAAKIVALVMGAKAKLEEDIRAMVANGKEGWQTEPADKLLASVNKRIGELKARNAFRSWASYSLSTARDAFGRREEILNLTVSGLQFDLTSYPARRWRC